MSTEYDPPVILDCDDAKASIIWLHGLGDDGNGFVPVATYFQQHFPNIRIVLPHAPRQAVSINGGYVMRSWYDIRSMNFTENEDETGFNQSRDYVDQLVKNEVNAGIAEENIILAGFSQGGAVSLYAALSSSRPFAGVIALSCYLPLEQSLARLETQVPRKIFLAHGEYDPLVPLALSKHSDEKLNEWNHQVEWHHYPIEHAVSPDELDDMLHWLKSMFN